VSEARVHELAALIVEDERRTEAGGVEALGGAEEERGFAGAEKTSDEDEGRGIGEATRFAAG
jgi:hypothetical protein